MRYISTRVNELKAGDIWTLCVPPYRGPYVYNIVLCSRGKILRCLRIEDNAPKCSWNVPKNRYDGIIVYLLDLQKNGFTFKQTDGD